MSNHQEANKVMEQQELKGVEVQGAQAIQDIQSLKGIQEVHNIQEVQAMQAFQQQQQQQQQQPPFVEEHQDNKLQQGIGSPVFPQVRDKYSYCESRISLRTSFILFVFRVLDSLFSGL